jgi:hypothetical protein
MRERTGESNQMSVRLSIRVLALALAAVVSWSLWAECALVAASTPNMQMACCKDGEFKCAAHGSATDCCATDAARPRAVLTAARIDPVHALVAVVARAVVPGLATLDSAAAITHQPISPPRISAGPPPYIAFSSLLI